MVWDIHNQGVVRSMGMAWDTGPPVWPYETASILFYALNFPAFFPSVRVANLFELLVPKHYWVVFPAAVLWWWVVGMAYKARVWRRSFTGYDARVLAFVFGALSLFLTVIGLNVAGDSLRWWFEYNQGILSDQTLLLVMFLAPAFWIFLFAFIAAAMARKSFARQS